MNKTSESTEAIVEALYEGTLDQRAWSGALTAIAGLVGGSGVLLMSLDPGS